MVLRGATSLWEALEGVGPENRDFFGPWNGTSEASAIWAQKSREWSSIGRITAIKSYTSPIKCMFSKASVIARCREYVVLKTIHSYMKREQGLNSV